MPGPEPGAVWIEESDGVISAVFERYFWTGNTGNRAKRAVAMLRRVKRGTWVCQWCGYDLPDYRRTDAQYCSEGCRKRSARARRKLRKVSHAV